VHRAEASDAPSPKESGIKLEESPGMWQEAWARVGGAMEEAPRKRPPVFESRVQEYVDSHLDLFLDLTMSFLVIPDEIMPSLLPRIAAEPAGSLGPGFLVRSGFCHPIVLVARYSEHRRLFSRSTQKWEYQQRCQAPESF
jgi:hypothetical protein